MRELGARGRALFGEGDRRSTVLGSMLIFALVLTCIASIWMYKQVVPEHAERDTINISMTDYEQALAKWNSANIAEYRITLVQVDSEAKQQITLRVNQEEDEIYLLGHLYNESPFGNSNPNRPLPPGEYEEYTVDGLFAHAREWLDLALSGERLEPSSEDTDFFHDYNIRFDPDFGYPTNIEDWIRSAHLTREVVWRELGERRIRIENFTVER